MPRAGSAAGAVTEVGRIIRLVGRGFSPSEVQSENKSGEIPRIPYGAFLRLFDWKQGQHITLIGPTGYGKTTLALDLLTRRDYVMAFGTKKEDDTLEKLLRRGYVRVQNLSEVGELDKVIIWPHTEMLSSADEITEMQRLVFREALFSGVFRQGRWTAYLDELRYITSRLKLASEVELLWEQGRSIKASVVAGYQRPANIPLLAYDQPEHLFFFKETDRVNLERIAEVVAWLDRRLLINTIARIPKYDFVYLNKERELAVISRAEA